MEVNNTLKIITKCSSLWLCNACKHKFIDYSHSPTCAIPASWKVRHKQELSTHYGELRVCVYTRESIWNPNLSSQETDRLLSDRPADFVIAQAYSSTTFSHCPGIPTRKKIRWTLKILTWFSIFNCYGTVWHESAWRWGESVCIYLANSRHCSSAVPCSWAARGLGKFVLSCVKYW